MFAKFFKPINLHIKLHSNRIEIINLDTGESAAKTATENFSTPRIVIGNFSKANKLIEAVFEELDFRKMRKKTFGALRVLIQQMEKLEGGLSDIEKRAMRDLSEQAGADYVAIVEHANTLSVEEARLLLPKMETKSRIGQ
jgi:hypothetical protein